jgi:hypothetical protein
MKVVTAPNLFQDLFNHNIFTVRQRSRAELIHAFKKRAKAGICRQEETALLGSWGLGLLPEKKLTISPGDRVARIDDFIAVREKNTLLQHIFGQANQWTVFDSRTGEAEKAPGLKMHQVIDTLAAKSATRYQKDHSSGVISMSSILDIRPLL